MADADFEDDLFADLYTEDDAPAKAAPTPEVNKEPAPPAIVTTEVKPEEKGNGGQQMYTEVEEEDDEIDFNLGGGGNGYEAPTSHVQSHELGIKEDG
ncbi:hypothetical protein BJ878DRAFT_223533 [Calycina marina]|uniref:Uncharacterized protein n=1 Tax=Calycina marina TaxID=1763456 RepID=A0A9P8CCE7_9HELO|nr:hypothetical protein BJ878DRAFT_223533 [Calycina marina]